MKAETVQNHRTEFITRIVNANGVVITCVTRANVILFRDLKNSKTKTKLWTIFVIDYHNIACNLVKTPLSASEAGAKKKTKITFALFVADLVLLLLLATWRTYSFTTA